MSLSPARERQLQLHHDGLTEAPTPPTCRVPYVQGSADLAVSQAIGSNVFNILVALGLPYCIVLAAKGATTAVRLIACPRDAMLIPGAPCAPWRHCLQHVFPSIRRSTIGKLHSCHTRRPCSRFLSAGRHSGSVGERGHPGLRCHGVCCSDCQCTLAHDEMGRLGADCVLWRLCGVASIKCMDL